MNKKLLGVLLSFFVLSSCGPSQSNGTLENDPDIVTVKSIEPETYGNPVFFAKKAKGVFGEDNEEETPKTLVWNFVADINVDYGDEADEYENYSYVTFTVELDNPEGYGIDALRFWSDDKSALILVDGVWRKIAYEADGTRVINWSSENPYEKTFDIMLCGDADINTISVVDIRLAGHAKFQSKEHEVKHLGHNKLLVYRVPFTEQPFMRTNTAEYYMEFFKTKNYIQNVEVNGAGSRIENGFIVATENGMLTGSYDYVFEDGTVFHSVFEREVQLLDLRFLDDGSGKIVDGNWIRLEFFGGTDSGWNIPNLWAYMFEEKDMGDGWIERISMDYFSMHFHCVDHRTGKDTFVFTYQLGSESDAFDGTFDSDFNETSLEEWIDNREKNGDLVYVNYVGSSYTFDRVNNSLVLMN